MANSTPVLFPKSQRILSELGENIKLARLRRKLSSEQVAERADIGRSTLVKIEQGHPGVGIGNYLNVLRVLGLEQDFLLLAKDDELGRKLQDAHLVSKERAPKKSKNGH
ncbi:Helix-turn-helix domain-containing protein [Aquiflexum balticum DSM 16537]|uniref:Helix-turn-helix domain-containing protein n=1 Tax=Aquiflexum balticum DSM 16537 TaxID=758820 RepID=A0A1W2H1J1_9BACT|nr:helix-turn-helix domain-containing protein [Aquiflexum balticum]SMD42759.1 Helix-turn-helix domain-containing protein [Aquiflexum balticum DSM 16537]